MFNSQLPSRDDLPSTVSLLKSTIIAMAAAAVILITIVLPAEYGIDPTRIGRVLGLTEMGEIKMQLAEEAASDRQATSEASAEGVPVNDVEETTMSLASESDTSAETAIDPVSPGWRDTISITLQPGEATEVKLSMMAGDVATYEWSTDQAGLNSDLHGDNPSEQFISYRQGRNETGDAGEFTAEFDGSHGWYWRNRSDVAVTVTLNTGGQYSAINRLF